MVNLLHSRNARWAGRFGHPRILRRKVEVVGVRVCNARLVARLPGQPDEKALKGRQGGVQGRLAQRLPASAPALFGKIALESLRLLDMELLEVPPLRIGFEAGNSLRRRINCLLAVPQSFDKIGEIPALDPLVRRVVGASSAAAFHRVTIHVGLCCLFYSRSCLSDHDVEVTAYRFQFLRIDPAGDHPVTVRADALKRAGGVPGLDAFRDLPGRQLRRAARQTVDAAGTTGLLRARAALDKKSADLLTTDQDRALIVDWLQALLEPVAHRVLVDLEQAR